MKQTSHNLQLVHLAQSNGDPSLWSVVVHFLVFRIAKNECTAHKHWIGGRMSIALRTSSSAAFSKHHQNSWRSNWNRDSHIPSAAAHLLPVFFRIKHSDYIDDKDERHVSPNGIFFKAIKLFVSNFRRVGVPPKIGANMGALQTWVHTRIVEVRDVFSASCSIDEVVRREGIRSHVEEGGSEAGGKVHPRLDYPQLDYPRLDYP